MNPGIETKLEAALQEGGATRTSQANISAALAAAEARTRAGLHSASRLPGEQNGHSLAEVAQHDLDAALHLLADRAQYITGSSGAAIALRRAGRNDMQCRASTGANAPELGALLSTEFGLSGESVRTRRPLRCDDAERDARVNREVCRQMGIASVIIMPVVHDDEVLGVFELFSGNANAFGERDLSALERLSQMVETAVTLAQIVGELPDRLKAADQGSAPAQESTEEEMLLEVEAEESVSEIQGMAEIKVESAAEVVASGVPEKSADQELSATDETSVATVRTEELLPARSEVDPHSAPMPPASGTTAAPHVQQSAAPSAPTVPAKKPLYWSAAGEGEPEQPAEDQSHFPPVLRNLKKCEACGFPVSPTRVLCVDCEEKKWRGQLKTHPPSLRSTVAPPVPADATAGLIPENAVATADPSPAASTAEEAPRAFAAAAQSSVAIAPVSAPFGAASVRVSSGLAILTPKETEKPSAVGAPNTEAEPVVNKVPLAAAEPAPQPQLAAAPDFVLSAGLEPQESWFAAHKYVVLALLAVVAAAAAFVFLR